VESVYSGGQLYIGGYFGNTGVSKPPDRPFLADLDLASQTVSNLSGIIPSSFNTVIGLAVYGSEVFVAGGTFGNIQYGLIASSSMSPPSVVLHPATTSGPMATITGYVLCENSDPNMGYCPPYSWNWGDGQRTTGYFPQTHTYSQSGTYDVVVTAINDVNGLGGSMSETVTVQFSSSSSSTTASGATSAPPWAFSGAYARYYEANRAWTNDTITEAEVLGAGNAATVEFVLSDINVSAQTYTIACNASGNKTDACSGPATYSFSQAFAGPALTVSELQAMNGGQVPSDFATFMAPGGGKSILAVSADQVITVPAGSFKVDEFSAGTANGTYLEVFYDTNTGLEVKAFINFNASQNGPQDLVLIELASTNIATSTGGPGSNSPFITNATDLIVLALAVVVAASVIITIMRRKKPNAETDSGASAGHPDMERVKAPAGPDVDQWAS
jgi:PKD repeat protein